MRRLPAVLLLVALAAVAVAGCGLGAGGSAGGTRLVVTEDFGSKSLIDDSAPTVGGSDTVMRFLQRNVDRVTTRYGGGFVQSIAGRAGGTFGGRPYDWFFYVNGVLAEKGAASTKLRTDDVVWWDRHDWGESNGVPAVVGSFPEPFRHGIDGRRLPVRVECTAPRSPACKTTQQKLTAAGVPAFGGGLQTSLTKETLRVIVGPYATIRGDETANQLERGPQKSGVYAVPSRDGRTIRVLDPRGRTAKTLGAGTGLVAATRYEDGQPVWIVTGTDVAGTLAAAQTLDEATLKDRYALAVSDGLAVDVPQVAAPR